MKSSKPVSKTLGRVILGVTVGSGAMALNAAPNGPTIPVAAEKLDGYVRALAAARDGADLSGLAQDAGDLSQPVGQILQLALR